jgi:spermidine synthase
VLSLLLATGAGLTTWLEDRLYDDTVVLADSTRYQRIVVTRFRDDTRLFLDGHLQFSSRDEARYHEPLVHPAMAAASSRRRVLLLGGGDGMAVREVLRWQPGAVTLVDLDPELVAWFRDRDELAALNGLALRDARVSAVHRDAVRFLEDDPGGWDVIVADLPDPHDAALSRLYAAPFYRLALSRLAEGGAFVTQATSPFYARDAWDCLVATVRGEAGARPVRPYLSHVPSFGLWGFVLVGDEPRAALPQGLRYLDDAVLRASFVLPRDIAPRDAAPNGLADARLARLYQRGWREWNDR